jgi:hypothetical protein
VSSVVAIGRLMNGDERLIARFPAPGGSAAAGGSGAGFRARGQLGRELVKEEIDHRRRVEGQQLAEDQAADDRDPERTAQLRAHPLPEGERHGAEHGGHGRHQDRAEAKQAGLVDRVEGFLCSWRSAASAKSIIMIAFFWTMPIRSTMPMIATTVSSLRQISSARMAPRRPRAAWRGS